MNINYWNCEHGGYITPEDVEIKDHRYTCNHPNGNGTCILDNKADGKYVDCKLLDEDAE